MVHSIICIVYRHTCYLVSHHGTGRRYLLHAGVPHVALAAPGLGHHARGDHAPHVRTLTHRHLVHHVRHILGLKQICMLRQVEFATF